MFESSASESECSGHNHPAAERQLRSSTESPRLQAASRSLCSQQQPATQLQANVSRQAACPMRNPSTIGSGTNTQTGYSTFSSHCKLWHRIALDAIPARKPILNRWESFRKANHVSIEPKGFVRFQSQLCGNAALGDLIHEFNLVIQLPADHRRMIVKLTGRRLVRAPPASPDAPPPATAAECKSKSPERPDAAPLHLVEEIEQ